MMKLVLYKRGDLLKLNLQKHKNLKRLMTMMLTHKKLVSLSFFLMIVYSSIVAISPRILMEVIDTLSNTHNLKKIKYLVFFIIILALLEIICKICSDYLFSLIGKKVTTKIKLDILKKLFTFDGKYISKLNVGDHINILDMDTKIIEQIATQTIFDIVCSFLSAIFIIAMLISLQWDMVLIIIILQVIIIFLQVNFTKTVVVMRTEVRELAGKITNLEQEILGSFMTVNQLNVKDFVIKKIEDKQNKYVKSILRFEWLCGLNLSRIKIINIATLSYILIVGSHKITTGLLTIGGLITFINYSQKICTPIQNIIKSNVQIQQALISLEKIFSLLDYKGIDNSDKKNILEDNYKISLDEVEFSYEYTKNLMKYDNMDFYPNAINVIVGKSGVGKSTLIKLLYRLWNVNYGEICLNGININNYDISSVRNKIGVINQNIFIFNDSVINNLILGKENFKIDFIEDICKKVKIHDDIMKLPDKYETVLGDEGINLSGGQLQRLAIARILIIRPNIIIMDEPTSALDIDLEQEIWFNLYGILKESTTIIITHRKEVLKYADYIYDLSSR